MATKLINNDKRYLKQLDKEHLVYFNSLPEELKKSIRFYTGAGHKNINNYMRGLPIISTNGSYESEIIEIKRHIENINQVLENAPKLQYALEVFRGMRLPSDTTYRGGDVINLFQSSFTSTSFDLDTSIAFSGDACCLFILYLPPGTHGLYIGKSSTEGIEYEYLLSSGTTFKIISKGRETIPLRGISPNKVNLATYRAICLNCDLGLLEKNQYRPQSTQITESVVVENIDAQYLVGLSPKVLKQIDNLSRNCEQHNYLVNPKTGRCVRIDGKVGKDVITYLKSV